MNKWLTPQRAEVSWSNRLWYAQWDKANGLDWTLMNILTANLKPTQLPMQYTVIAQINLTPLIRFPRTEQAQLIGSLHIYLAVDQIIKYRGRKKTINFLS